ncbi:MAG: DUF6799 domain-containing protein [Bacteroidia bacterium]
MKKVIITFIASISFLCIHAQENNKLPETSDYCLLVKGDTEVLMKDGKEVTTDIKLESGDQLSPNGRVMKMNGTEIKLKEGDCVTEKGEVVRQKK